MSQGPARGGLHIELKQASSWEDLLIEFIIHLGAPFDRSIGEEVHPTLVDVLLEAGRDLGATLYDPVSVVDRQAVQCLVVGLAIEYGECCGLDLVELQTLEERVGDLYGSGLIVERIDDLSLLQARVVVVEFLEVQHTQRRERPMAMDDIWDPTELLDGFEGTTHEEDRALVVVVAYLGVDVEDGLTLEEIIVVDEVYLQAGGRQ